MEGKTFTEALKRFTVRHDKLPGAEHDPVGGEHAERDRRHQQQMSDAILNKTKGHMFQGVDFQKKQTQRTANKRAAASRRTNRSK